MKSRIPNRNSISRKVKVQKKYNEYILVVTEGEKTEPIYFNALRKAERIITAKLEVCCSEYGSNPLSVVDYAIDLKRENLRANKRDGEPKYDVIYCVIDRDDHERYHEAISKAKGNGIEVIRSIPCFEFWYLLHFGYTSRSYDKRNILYSRLKSLIGSYEKSDSVYLLLRDKIDKAILNAQRLRVEHSKVLDLEKEHPNPYTEVDLLVTRLLTLSDQ